MLTAYCAEQMSHAEDGADATRIAALDRLLDGLPAATLYLIGPPKSPVGYMLIAFGFDLSAGGVTATIGELYIRAAVRGRGMGSDAVATLAHALHGHGVCALHMEASDANPRAKVFCRRLGFDERTDTTLLIRTL